MKRRSKLLSILLSLALVVGMIPAFGVTSLANETPSSEITGIVWNADNSVTFTTDQTAMDRYWVAVYDGSQNIRYGSSWLWGENNKGRIVFNGNTATITKECIETLLALRSESGYYRIGVWFDGKTETLRLTEGKQIEIKRLDPPTNLRWEGTVAKWDPIPKADNYLVHLYYASSHAQTGYWNTSEPSLDFADSMAIRGPGTSYYFSVIAMGSTLDAGESDVATGPVVHYNGPVLKDFYVYITPPVPGQHPQAPVVNTDDYSISAYNWIETTDTESGSVARKMTASDVFKEGVFYQCRVDLLVKDGIVGEAEELTGYVNDSTKTDGMDVITSRNGSFKVKVIGSYTCSSAKANPFADVSESDYFYEPVLWAVGKGFTNGTDDTHFSPNATCTRGQVVTFLWRAAGSPAPSSTTNPFTDVNSSDYYYNAVLWAVGKNITNGTSPTTFGPNDGCTRGQVVTFLHRFENTPTPASSTNPFEDVSSSEYYYTPVLWAVGKGITNGTDATHFSPNDTCTRGQIVTFLYRDMK